MKRQLLMGFFVLLSCLVVCFASQHERCVVTVQVVDTIEQSAELAIDEQAHEIRNRFFMKSPLMKRIDVAINEFETVSIVERFVINKEDTKKDVTYDFYAREAGGMPATTNFLQ